MRNVYCVEQFNVLAVGSWIIPGSCREAQMRNVNLKAQQFGIIPPTHKLANGIKNVIIRMQLVVTEY